MKTAVFFILARMESTAVLYFLRKGVKLHFYSLGTIFEENMWGIQRGIAPRLWVSNRGESIPVGTRFCLQSLVCYTFAKERAAGWDGFGLSSWRTRCLCGEYQRQRKAGRWCGLHSSASLSPSVEQRYITLVFRPDISLRLALC